MITTDSICVREKTKFLPDLNGVYYLEYLRHVHERLTPRTYVEIGTQSGKSLSLASCASIAIDPHFVIGMDVVGRKPLCSLFQVTSNQYFTKYRPEKIFGQNIDFAFLDGLHLFEFLLQDFINVERNCYSDSLIAMHDCLPTDVYIAERKDDAERRRSVGSKPAWWTGDVWKILPILYKWRPDLTIISIDCAPTGLVFVTDLNPDSRVLAENFNAIVDEFMDIDLLDYGLERYHAEAKIQSATEAKLPFRRWRT